MLDVLSFLGGWAILSVLVCSTGALADDAPVKIVLVGDSTVCEYPDDIPTRGWGMYLQGAFRSSVRVINLAKSGRSTKTFRTEGLWDRVLAERPDWVFIQMGHNDSHGAGRPEATDAATDYPENLRRFVREAREIDSKVVLVTPMVRRTFNDDGTPRDNLAVYAEAMKSVASEMSVPLIDLHASSLQLLRKQGDAGSWAFADDDADRSLGTARFPRIGASAYGVVPVAH